MIPQRVQAQAVVDVGAFEVADRINHVPFVVTCSGELAPGGDPLPSRIYEIAAVDDTTAAFTCLDRYVIEMERLN